MLQVVRSIRYKRLFWAYLLFSCVTAWVCFFYEPTINTSGADLHVRVWAMLLQLIGAGTVWYDLTHTATEYGEGPSVRKSWDYIKSVFVKPPAVTGSVSATLEGAYMIGTGRISSVLNPEQPMDLRVAQLERFAQKLDVEVGDLQAAITYQKSELTADLKKRATELHQEVRRVEGQLKQALIGNFSILNFGVIWLMVGIVLASVPLEITDLAAEMKLFDLFR